MTSPTRSAAKKCRETGFSSLEALAALMVLNLLLIGLFSRQLQAWQAQREALAWPQGNVDALPDSSAVADCPKLHRCWQTSWPP
jgi:hypothetical protein